MLEQLQPRAHVFTFSPRTHESFFLTNPFPLLPGNRDRSTSHFRSGSGAGLEKKRRARERERVVPVSEHKLEATSAYANVLLPAPSPFAKNKKITWQKQVGSRLVGSRYVTGTRGDNQSESSISCRGRTNCVVNFEFSRWNSVWFWSSRKLSLFWRLCPVRKTKFEESWNPSVGDVIGRVCWWCMWMCTQILTLADQYQTRVFLLNQRIVRCNKKLFLKKDARGMSSDYRRVKAFKSVAIFSQFL